MPRSTWPAMCAVQLVVRAAASGPVTAAVASRQPAPRTAVRHGDQPRPRRRARTTSTAYARRTTSPATGPRTAEEVGARVVVAGHAAAAGRRERRLRTAPTSSRATASTFQVRS